MRFMDKMRYSLTRFLYGRYGVDQLGRFLSIMITILLVISIFWRNMIVTAVALVLLIWMYFQTERERVVSQGEPADPAQLFYAVSAHP